MKVNIIKSNRADKKLKAIFYDDYNNIIKTVHFGATGYSDYIKSGGDDRKKELYIKRHQVRENFNNYMSAGALSRWILWNKPTLNESIKDYKKKFNLK